MGDARSEIKIEHLTRCDSGHGVPPHVWIIKMQPNKQISTKFQIHFKNENVMNGFIYFLKLFTLVVPQTHNMIWCTGLCWNQIILYATVYTVVTVLHSKVL